MSRRNPADGYATPPNTSQRENNQQRFTPSLVTRRQCKRPSATCSEPLEEQQMGSPHNMFDAARRSSDTWHTCMIRRRNLHKPDHASTSCAGVPTHGIRNTFKSTRCPCDPRREKRRDAPPPCPLERSADSQERPELTKGKVAVSLRVATHDQREDCPGVCSSI